MKMMTGMGGHPWQLLVITALLTFDFAVVTAQSSQVYTLCQLREDDAVELSAASPPFIIRSPNFPRNYNNSSRCTLVLQSGFEPLVITFKYSTFDLEKSGSCVWDSLCVHGAKFCGQWPAGNEFQYILPANRTFTILFRSDASVTARGFDIIVTPGLALTGLEIFQPQGDGYSGDLLRYIRVVYPSVPLTLDYCEAIAIDEFDEFSGN